MLTVPLIIVQNNLVEKLTGPVAKAAHELGIDVFDVSASQEITLPYSPLGRGPILIIGSIVFVDTWRQRYPALAKWVYWDDTQFDAGVWKNKLGKYFLNHDGYASTVEEFINSYHQDMHVRPRSEIKMVGDKRRIESQTGQESIAGLVTTPKALKERNINEDTLIWVSHPKEIVAEVRVWMIGGKPVAASMYRLLGKPSETIEGTAVKDACAFAGVCHHLWHPDQHYVIDVALMTDNFHKVIEYNPIHSSGWYAADPKAIIQSFMTISQP